MFNSNLLLKVRWGERSWKNIWATRHRGGFDNRGQQPDPETNFRKNNPDSAGGSLLLVRCPVGSFCPGDVVCVSKQKQVDQRHWKGQKHDHRLMKDIEKVKSTIKLMRDIEKVKSTINTQDPNYVETTELWEDLSNNSFWDEI